MPLLFRLSLALLLSSVLSSAVLLPKQPIPPTKKPLAQQRQQQRLLRLEKRLQTAKRPQVRQRLTTRLQQMHQAASDPKKDWTLSIVAFTLSAVGLAGGWLLSILLIALLAGFILAIFGYIRVNKYPEKYGGRGLCIASFAIFALAVLFLAVVVAFISGTLPF